MDDEDTKSADEFAESLRMEQFIDENICESPNSPNENVDKSNLKFITLSQKQLKNEKSHKCGVCFRRFRESYILNIHVMEEHDRLKIFKCEFCDKDFQETGCLKRHIERLHKRSKRYKCRKCEKTFMNPSEAEQHANVHQSGRKPFRNELTLRK